MLCPLRKQRSVIVFVALALQHHTLTLTLSLSYSHTLTLPLIVRSIDHDHDRITVKMLMWSRPTRSSWLVALVLLVSLVASEALAQPTPTPTPMPMPMPPSSPSMMSMFLGRQCDAWGTCLELWELDDCDELVRTPVSPVTSREISRYRAAADLA